MKLTNLSSSPLGIPGNPTIEPGESINCQNWGEVQHNRIVISWIERGMLGVGGGAEVASDPTALKGSDQLPNEIEIAEGVHIPLQTVVVVAFEKSGLSFEEWNELDSEKRDDMLSSAIATLSEQANASDEDPEDESEESDSDSGSDDGQSDESDNSEEDSEDEDAENDEKDELIAKLKELGVHRDRRTSVEKLRELLEENETE